MNPTPGDKVKITVGKQSYFGVLLPAADLEQDNTILLKLDSGYNIGFSSAEVTNVEFLEKRKEKPKKMPKVSINPEQPTVSILSTGGTISSKIDYTTGGVSASLTAQDLLDSMPELKGGVNLTTNSLMNVMSEDMNPSHWVDMAKKTVEELNSESQGVVLTHGTDTMHYSTAALSLLLNGTTKPVILTGSQRSTDRGSSDGFMNLSHSILLAKSDYAGVGLVMHGSINDDYCLAHHGTRVRKMHTSRRDAFKSINDKPFAKIDENGVTFLGEHKQRGQGEVVVDGGLEQKVGFIKAYPGMPADIVDYYIDKGVKGIVFEGTGLGHLPVTESNYSLLDSVDRAVEEGILLAMSAQTLFGRVHPNVYGNLRKLSTRGVVYCGDMLPETCFVKTMWVLDKSKDVKTAEKLLIEPINREISKSSRVL